jgi:CHAT domain-containing protein
LAIAQLLARAIEQASSIDDARSQSYALGYLGKLYETTQQWSDARDLTERALLIARAIEASDIVYQWQWQLGRILKARGEIEEATRAYEGAYTTLESLRGDLVAINRPDNPDNADLQFSFRESVEPVYREFVDLLLQARGTAEPSQENLKRAREVIESLQVAELDNFFRSACLEAQTISIEEIDQTRAAVIYPIILGDRLEVILSLPQQPLRHYSSSVSAGEVESTLEEFRVSLEKPYTAPEGKSIGKTVYDWLIRPAETELSQSQVKTLVFVLDGVLRNVPMAALYDGEQYLIEKYSLALAPGLQLLDSQQLSQGNLNTLAAGLTEARLGFSALVNVRRELEQIRLEVPARVLLDREFTSEALQKQIASSPFPVVHLATHGQFSSNANDTFILTWDERINVKELRRLLRPEYGNRASAIELLVLSACQTATGDNRAALGLAGVALEAGARSTLASLWNLDDESGARLISEFYRQLTDKNRTKAEAIQLAQLSLLKNPNYRHPLHWAPFVLVGNWL